MLHGIGASAGIGIGRAVLIREPDLDYSHVTPAGKEGELARLNAAVARFVEKTQAMARAMEGQVGQHQSEILMGQITMIQDPFMLSQMEELMDQGQCAEAALDGVCTSFAELFAAMEDELMSQRATDIRDMKARLLMELLGQEAPDLSALPPETVLVAHDLTPSMTAGLTKENVAAILTEAGGTTSHSAILARAMELPAVLSAEGAMAQVQNGDPIIVDGDQGLAILNPDGNTLAQYQTWQKKQLAQKAALSQYTGLPTCTANGRRVDLYGNIGTPGEAAAVMEATGEGIGLFRTEFLFLDRPAPPSEAEQYAAYRQAAETMGDREVIIRTLDVGGDKDIPYLGLEREENPFLGCRAIRFCLEREDLFRPQLRAILRASAHGNLKVMLPLVTRLEEVRRTKAILDELRTELDRENIPYDPDLNVGIMIETPAAALLADLLAREVDFFSIGTNDLTQYVMTADRGNAHVAPLGVPLQPAVLRAIRQVIAAGKQAGIPVGMCGEAAADPRMIPLLLAFGLDEFSVNPSAVLATRKVIAQWSDQSAAELAERVMGCGTLEEVLGCWEQ